MYERAYGKEHLWEDAADDLMDQTYREIVEAEGIEPIDRPDAKLTQLKEGEPLRYTATVVVRPDVELGDYLAHGAKVEAAPPTDEDIERTIASMRDTHAQLRPVDREARAGDILTVDIDAAVPGKTLPPFARNAHIEAGKDLGIAGLGEALVGMKVGEEKKVDLAFPNDASENELAGKTATFSIRPSQVAEKILPALDDEFAKTVGVADIAALRSAAVLGPLARSIRNRKTVDKLVGLDSPDAEREAIKKAGGEDFDPHGAGPAQAAEAKIIVPEKSDATPEGRDAIRALLEK